MVLSSQPLYTCFRIKIVRYNDNVGPGSGLVVPDYKKNSALTLRVLEFPIPEEGSQTAKYNDLETRVWIVYYPLFLNVWTMKKGIKKSICPKYCHGEPMKENKGIVDHDP